MRPFPKCFPHLSPRNCFCHPVRCVLTDARVLWSRGWTLPPHMLSLTEPAAR